MKYYKIREDYLLHLLEKEDKLDAIYCAMDIAYDDYKEFLTKSEDLKKHLHNYEEI